MVSNKNHIHITKNVDIKPFPFWERFFSTIKKLGIYDSMTSKFLPFFTFSILIAE